MTPESKSRLVIIAEITGLVLVLVAVGFIISRVIANRGGSTTDTTSQNNTQGVGGTNSETLGNVPAGTHVPESGETASGDVAVPVTVIEAAPGVQAKSRSYTVAVSGNKFTPSTVVVRLGDTTSIRFTAEDGDYDFTQPDLGLSAKLLKGKEQLIQVTPSNPGKFMFFCASCGGPDKGPVGYLVVVPKE